MRILLGHTFYQQSGGEEAVFFAEKKLLESRGHTVILYQRYNHEPGAVTGVLWSQKSYRELRSLIRKTQPDLAHFHNTFLAISPSAYHACQTEGVQVVQTLHNFRLVCPGALLLRNEKPCKDCLGRKIPWPGVIHACWRGSHMGSALTASMLSLHHALGTWQNKVDRYIALSEFSRQKFIQGGLPAKKITVKPNFLTDPGIRKNNTGEYALFVGRLSQEKGIDALLDAWQNLPGIPLKIIGDGPLFEKVKQEAKKTPTIEFLGKLERDNVFGAVQKARFLVIPSICYENFPLTVLEAFASGVPVITSRLGSLETLVMNGQTGLHFTPRNAQELAEKATWLWQNPQEAALMGQNARREYEEKYTPENNYRQLMSIYEQVLAEKKDDSKPPPHPRRPR